MPSPLAHGAVAWWIERRAGIDAPGTRPPRSRRARVVVFGVFWGLSVLPDFDFLPGLLLGDVEGWHNGPSHSLVAGLVAALVLGPIAGLVLGRFLGGGTLRWTGIVLASYWSHVLLDALTLGRGVRLLWPFVPDRLTPPFCPFYGVRWSEGLFESTLFWTLANELAFVVFVVSATLAFARRAPDRSEPGR